MTDDTGTKAVTAEEYNTLQTKLNEADSRAKRFESMATDLEKQVKAWGDLKPDSVKGMLEDYELMKRDKATKGTPDDLKAWQDEQIKKIRGDVQKELERLTTERDELSSRFKELSIVDKASEEIGGYFNDDVQPFIKGIIRQFVDKDENGDWIVKNDKGEVRFSPTSPANKLTLREFAEELAGRHPSFARPQVKKGVGQNGTINPTGKVGDIDVSRYLRMSPEERANLEPKLRGQLAIAAAKQVPITNKQ